MIDRLKKLMMLTTSESDGEALNALRAANRLLKENDKTWEQAFDANDGKWRKEYTKLVDEYNALAEKYNSLLVVATLASARAKKRSLFGLF